VTSPQPDVLTLRMALGIEPADPVRGGRIGQRLTAAIDGVPLAPSRTRRDPDLPPWAPQDVLERIPRTKACRFRLLQHPALPKDKLAVRIWDDSRRYVPRRLDVDLLNNALVPPAKWGRIVRPALWPGAAYGIPAGAVGCRGWVKRGTAPLRWARVEAKVGTTVVGRAHGDDRGEFVLLLGSAAAPGPELNFPLNVTVTVFGPTAVPVPAPGHQDDPLWDLPLEAVPAAGADAVLAGTALPTGYRATTTPRSVSFGPDGLSSELFVFT
jgi:hypothetical protein